MTMKIGIIGTGKHGSRYARHIVNDFPDLVAIARRSSVGIELVRKWNCRYFTDWRDLLADKDVEAVISVVPPTLNLDIARACAAAEKAPFLEKPLAADVAAGDEIVTLFQESNIPLTVAQTLRYNSVVKGLKKNIHRTGKLYSFSASHRLEPSILKWLEDSEEAGAGVILHTAVHMYDCSFSTGLA